MLANQTETVTSTLLPFHLAFPVGDIEGARKFYGQLLGCSEGRSSETWVDFDFFGHQLVAHYRPTPTVGWSDVHHNAVDGHDVPVPHFGCILSMESWRALRDRLVAAEIKFKIEPYIRFEGEVGEQATMFFLDPWGNALEFKAFKDLSKLFAK